MRVRARVSREAMRRDGHRTYVPVWVGGWVVGGRVMGGDVWVGVGKGVCIGCA